MRIEKRRSSSQRRQSADNFDGDDFRWAEEMLRVEPAEALEALNRLHLAGRQSRNPAQQARAAIGIARASSLLGNVDEAMRHGREAAQLFQMLGDKSGEGRAANEIGVIHMRQKELSQAILEYERALRLFEESGEERGVANSHGNLGTVHYDTESYDLALHHYVQAAAVFAKLGLLSSLADTYSNVSLLFKEVGQLDSALRYINKAIENLAPDSEPDDRSRMIGNRGAILLDMNQLEPALDDFHEAAKLVKLAGNTYVEARMNENIAEVHLNLGQHDQAIAAFILCIELLRTLKDRRAEEAECLFSLGMAYRTAGDPESAEATFRECWRTFADLDNDRGQARACFALAKLYDEQQRFELAAEFVRSAKVFVSTSLDPALSAEICLMSAQYAERSGDFEQAFREMKEHADVTRSRYRRKLKSVESLLKMQLALNPLIESQSSDS